MQPCEQMHDYMFIIYGLNVSVLYFVKVYTFLILKVLFQVFYFNFYLFFVIVSTQEKKRKKKSKWNENHTKKNDYDA